mmetsp:Transcript_22750/g.43494  ORF Transcript_22750/g.43494 Transcript_22750/m.43494 type:complete len:703 (-) Transcript_22750:411-2519(-)
MRGQIYAILLPCLSTYFFAQGLQEEGEWHPFLKGTEPHVRIDNHQALRGVNPGALEEAAELYRETSGARKNTLRRGQPGTDPSEGWAVAGHSVVLNTTGPLQNNDAVRVTVTSVNPNATHWIAAYSPARANVSAVAPVKYAVLSEVDQGYVTSGRAEVTFRLTLSRSDYDFVLYTRDWPPLTDGWSPAHLERAVAVARSKTVTFADAGQPCKARVSLAGPRISNGDAEASDAVVQLRVQWSSGRGAECAPSLHWGDWEGPEASFQSVPASTSTYSAEEMCASPATGQGYRDIGWIHSALVEVAPGRQLGYHLTDCTGAKTRRYRLRVPPAPGGERRTRVAMLGDMGRGTVDDSKTWHQYGAPAMNVSLALGQEVARGELDAVFLFGDLSYAQGYTSVWDEWLDQVEPFAASVPFFTNQGNHEYDTPKEAWREGAAPDIFDKNDSGGECGVPSSRLVGSPGGGGSVSAVDYWARAFGSIFFVSMNTEIDFSRGSEQWRFLDKALASVNRTRTPWVVFAGHRAALVDSSYGPCSGEMCQLAGCRCGNGAADASDVGAMDLLQQHVGPLLQKYRVTLAFWGHNHAYQRMCAYDYATGACVQRSSGTSPAVYADPLAPIHMVVGTGGADFTVNARDASFSESVMYRFGYVRLTAENRTHLVGEFVEAAMGPGGKVLDSFAVAQTEPLRYSRASFSESSTDSLLQYL